MQINLTGQAGGAQSLVQSAEKLQSAKQAGRTRAVQEENQNRIIRAAELTQGSTLVQNADVSLSISDESREKYEEEQQAKEQQENALGLYQEQCAQQLQEQKESADSVGEAFKDLARIMEVARRIANGDHVPAQDEKKLMEFNSELYQASKAAAVVNANKKHKNYDSLFEEEKADKREKLRELEEGTVQTQNAAEGQSTDAGQEPEAIQGAAAGIDMGGSAAGVGSVAVSG